MVMKRIGMVLAVLLWSGVSVAGQTTAKVAQILLYEGGMLVYVYPVGGVVGAPACHGSNGSYYSFSMTRPMAKEYLALLTTAYVRGSTVLFVGTGTCSDQSVSESLSYFRLED